MVRVWLLLGLLLASMPVQGGVDDCGPPCGYVDPILDLEFPDKPLCGGGRILFDSSPPPDCMPLPTQGDTQILEGTFRYEWETSNDATYPQDPQEEIRVTFAQTASTPAWLSARIVCDVDPCEFVITQADMADPENFETREDAQGNPQVWFSYQQDVAVEITRHGDPDEDDLQKLAGRTGIQYVWVRALSSASGATFWEGYTIEEFRFDACADAVVEAALELCPGHEAAWQATEDASGSKRSPGVGLVMLVALMASVAVATRQRRG